MAVLKDLSQLGLAFKEEAIPPALDSFQTLAPPPLESFAQKAAKKSEMLPAYIKLNTFVSVSGTRHYAAFIFNRSFIHKSFKKPEESRFELVQHPANKQWFILQKAVLTKGNLFNKNSLNFNTSDYLNAKNLEKSKHYPLQIIKREGIVYFCLPAELVPLLA